MFRTVARRKTGESSTTGFDPRAVVLGTSVFHQTSSRKERANLPPSVREVGPDTVTVSPRWTEVGRRCVWYGAPPMWMVPQCGCRWGTTRVGLGTGVVATIGLVAWLAEVHAHTTTRHTPNFAMRISPQTLVSGPLV